MLEMNGIVIDILRITRGLQLLGPIQKLCFFYFQFITIVIIIGPSRTMVFLFPNLYILCHMLLCMHYSSRNLFVWIYHLPQAKCTVFAQT